MAKTDRERRRPCGDSHGPSPTALASLPTAGTRAWETPFEYPPRNPNLAPVPPSDLLTAPHGGAIFLQTSPNGINQINFDLLCCCCCCAIDTVGVAAAAAAVLVVSAVTVAAAVAIWDGRYPQKKSAFPRQQRQLQRKWRQTGEKSKTVITAFGGRGMQTTRAVWPGQRRGPC